MSAYRATTILLIPPVGPRVRAEGAWRADRLRWRGQLPEGCKPTRGWFGRLGDTLYRVVASQYVKTLNRWVIDLEEARDADD